MNRIKAIVIDDESFARDILIKLINSNCPELEIIGEAENVENAYQLITKTKPDLVFLDIHLAEDNSFNLFEKFDEINFEVIFTTGDSTYGIPAIKVNAVDYLLKPIDRDDLELAVKKVLRKRQNDPNLSGKEITIQVHNKDKVEYIQSSEIISLVAQDNYTLIHTIQGKKILASKAIGDLEETFSELNLFIRIHRSVMVNSNFISSYTKESPYIVTMKDGSVFEISRRKRTDVIAFFKNLS